MASDLWSIESVLTARALAAGATIRRGCRVSGVDAEGGGVLLHTGGKTFRGGWLVGCDGGRSAVRKAAGFTFAGTEPEFTGYFAQVVLAAPDALEPGHHDTAAGTYIYERPGTIRMVEFDGGASHRAGPITREQVEAVLRRVSGTDVRVTDLGLATTWTDRAYLAGEYRRGRVLLAGDAAHVHSPLGGQGLNLGIGDAANLGWKLAMAVLSDAPADLLDSYGRERRPVAEQVLDWSRAQVALMRPNPGTRALREVVRTLIETRDGATHVAERVWGLAMRYDLGSDHPLVGRSAPDLTLADGSRLNEHLRDGRGLLLDVTGDDRLRALAARRSRHVAYLEAAGGDPDGASALLVRPDGIVAWASDRPAAGRDADAALSRWFGDGRDGAGG